MKVRDQLLTNPLSIQPQLDKITKELQELATGTAAVRNMDLCDEAFVQLKESKSATGWIRSLGSNPVTGNHGNDRLDALAASAEKFQSEWNAILKKWKAGDQQGAANELENKSKTPEWKQFFNAVAKEMKDQARYDAWMTFGILVGIAIVTGFAGALLEPLAAAAVGPLLGFAVTVTTEAAMFTTMSYFLVEKHPTGAGFRTELGKNVLIFGALKGLSKTFAGLEKVLEIELKETEVISQFAAVNGIALYQANQEKAKHGETLTEADIMKISFDNLVFLIAVAIGGKALAPMFGKWRVKIEVGKGLKEIEALHAEVTALGEQAKVTKNKVVGQRLLDKQRELLTAEREYLEALLELTTKGRDAALKKGMTAQQYDALMGASKDLSSAVRGLHEAELMGKLEPITKGQYLCEPGKTFDDAVEHYSGDKTNKPGKVITDPTTKSRSFEVQLPDGSTLRISERAGKVGEVNTETKPTTTSGGEPAAPRGEEVAKAHGLSEPAAVQAFEALYKAHPKQVLELLDALKGEPSLANKLLAQFGESALSHFKPLGDGRLSIHAEIDIAPSKLRSLGDADIAKLVEVAKHKGPAADFEYFESTSTNGKPGARLRFKSRVRDRVAKMATDLKALLKLDPADKRAEIFDAVKMTEADAVRLWDLFNERAYKHADVRQQAADWAFSKDPKSAREFVAEMQFYDAEISKLADKYEGEARVELAKQLAARKAASGKDLTEVEATEATRAATKAKLGRAFDIDGPAWTRQANKRAIEEMAQRVTTDGKQSTIGRDAADAAWESNIDAQRSGPARTRRVGGQKTDLELPNHLKSIADTLQFAADYDAAYHAHKHAGELPSRPPQATEMVQYLKAARNLVRTATGITRANQDGSRSAIYEADGMRAIVQVRADGNAALTTFGKAN